VRNDECHAKRSSLTSHQRRRPWPLVRPLSHSQLLTLLGELVAATSVVMIAAAAAAAAAAA